MFRTTTKARLFAALIPVALIATGTGVAIAQTNSAATTAAAPQLPGVKDTARIQSGTYAVDPNHTIVGWEVNHFGFSPYFGQFGNATGSLVIDRTNPSAAQVDITIPIDSLSVVSSGLRTHMLTPDFFDQANHATARFVSNHIVFDEETDEAVMHGTLTIKGVSKPVQIEVEFVGAGANPMSHKQTVGFEGEATIRRSDFGINYALPVVSDEVKLTIAAAFEK